MFKVEISRPALRGIGSLVRYLEQYSQLQAKVNEQMAEEFVSRLRSRYRQIGSIDASGMVSFPNYYQSLKDSVNSIGNELKVVKAPDQSVIVMVDSKAMTPSGVKVLDLAYIIEYGLLDLGVPAYYVFRRAIKEMFGG